MATSKFRTMREEHLKDPTFRAEVAREKALMAEIGLAARTATGITRKAHATGAEAERRAAPRPHLLEGETGARLECTEENDVGVGARLSP
jgi:hypothetical protein